MHRIARWIVLSALVVGANAWAGPMSLWVGQKQTLYVFQKISKIEVSNPAVVKATRVPSVGLNLTAMAPGVTDVKIRCSDGTFYELRIHSTNGAEVYSTNRNEPEHYQWSLSSSESKPQAAAAKARKSTKRTV
jgi:Flp pilus assembly secretin CpaC